MRYITIPPPVKIFHPDTGAPVMVEIEKDGKTETRQAEADFASAIRHITNEMLKANELNLLDTLELRIALASAEVGQEVKIEDAWWEKLAEAFQRPNGFQLFYLIACRPHVLAVTQATTELRQL